MQEIFDINKIKIIVGLGNPGQKYYKNRHSIGFRVVEAIADNLCATWKGRSDYDSAQANFGGKEILLIKPQTFMNSSGRSLLFTREKGIKPNEVLVVHDELEKTFGEVVLKFGGSAKGHNGLKSIIDVIGQDFWRVRFGIGRPVAKEDVPDYVLTNFPPEQELLVGALIQKTTKIILG